jgi:alginate O-acetyltransferase complex protein AlgI
MRPFRSFLLLLIFLICFTGLFYIVPHSIRLPDIDVFIPSKLTHLFLSKDTLSSKTPGINSLPDFNPPLGGQGGLSPSGPVGSQTLPDSQSVRLVGAGGVTLTNPVIDSLPRTHLHRSLLTFLDSALQSKGQLRIMYYGDSQIEGDRVTSYLRQILRKGREGTGPGLFLPVMPVMYTKSLFIRSSSNWKRYTYLSFKNGEIGNNDLGPFMSVCRFLPDGVRSEEPVKASVRVVPSEFADSAVAVYDNLRIFYRNPKELVSIRISEGEKLITIDTLRLCSELSELSIRLNGSRDLRLEFVGNVSPDIFGLSIESTNGVIVDNIPHRGSAGMEFTMVGRKNLVEIFDKLRPDLFVLQYGLNVVRNIRNDYSYYENGLIRQISLLKKVSPGSRILVMSLTDMASREGDSIKSFPNIPAIRNAQKNAAEKEGVYFWDSFNAMGGLSSAGKWAGKKPPLFQKDYIHFTNQGADTISKLLYLAMFTEPVNEVKDTTETGLCCAVTGVRSQIAGFRLPVTGLLDTASQTTTTAPVLKHRETIFSTLVRLIFSYNPSSPFIFTSPAFWLFFLFVLASYSLVYKKIAIRNIYLFLISLFFYFKTGGLFLFLLIFVTVVDYTCGLLINGAGRKWARKLFLLVSLISNLGLLAWFKYAGFITESINELLGTNIKVYDLLASFSNSVLGTTFDINNIILPVGISFFTFQSLSYTIDIYRRKMEPVRNIVDFGFYVSFFPHLVAGPIVRASVFIPQIYQEYHLSKRESGHALFMISKGLIKKIIISNFIAINFVDRVFDAPALYSGFENLMAIYGYGLQIYCDFSGYTDIAIGIALLIGFRLPVNFNSPYKASDITDFWKRWHISLSQWLKDYLYISLGGNRKGKIRTYINLMLTMLLGGLWHGASLRFVIWGALHGTGLVINRIWNSIFGDRLRAGRAGRILAIFITFQFVSFCWIFFRAETMDNVFIMLQQIGRNFSPGSYSTVLPAYGNVFIMIVVGYIIHFLPESVKESYRGVFIRIPLAAKFAVIMLIAVMLYQLQSAEILPFIYFRF